MESFEMSNIIPFNDIFYKYCFYNPFFTVLNHFNIDIKIFISDDFFVYKYNEKNDDFYIMYLNSDDQFDTLRNNGVLVNTQNKSSNIVHDLKNSIRSNNPVILKLLRPITYLAFFGFDDSNKMFKTVKERGVDTILIDIPYEEIEIKYNRRIEKHEQNFGPIIEPTYFEFQNNNRQIPCTNEIDIKKTFIKNIITKKNDYRLSLDKDLRLFIKNFTQKVSSETIIKDNIEALLTQIKNIRNNKVSQKYSFEVIIGINDTTNLLEIIVENWKLIMALLTKYQISGKYSIEKIQKCIEKLNEIYEYEHKVLQTFDKLV